jgi:hypothetical protein
MQRPSLRAGAKIVPAPFFRGIENMGPHREKYPSVLGHVFGDAIGKRSRIDHLAGVW